MTINPAFLGHTIFTEFSVTRTLTRYENYRAPAGSPPPTPSQKIDRFIRALKDLHVQSVWIQLFSRGGDVEETDDDRALRATLIARLTHEKIKWVGWGYCSGKNWDTDKDLIVKFRDDLNMSAFAIDAEPGNKIYVNPAFPDDPDQKLPDLWTEADFDAFTAFVSQKIGKDNLALTTWPALQVQDDVAHGNPLIKLMKIAAPRVCLFVPQAYWMRYPTTVHYGYGLKEQDYPRDDPVSFVRLVIKSWRMLHFNGPLVIAGQAYWGEGSPAKDVMSGKVKDFTKNFNGWSGIVGFSWYHAGAKNTDQEGSMSDEMLTSISSAKLNAKPYKQP